jgi:hypothetical protein
LSATIISSEVYLDGTREARILSAVHPPSPRLTFSPISVHPRFLALHINVIQKFSSNKKEIAREIKNFSFPGCHADSGHKLDIATLEKIIGVPLIF